MCPVPDPEYHFLKPLPRHQTGYLGRSLRLGCLCAEDAQTRWLKGGEEVTEDENCHTYREEGESVLQIERLEQSDAGKYTCKIVKFGKEGEDSTSCSLNVIGNNLADLPLTSSHHNLNVQTSLTHSSRPCPTL